MRKDAPSDPMDKDRHLIDCVSYILLDDPRFIDQRGGLITFEPIYRTQPIDQDAGPLPAPPTEL